VLRQREMGVDGRQPTVDSQSTEMQFLTTASSAREEGNSLVDRAAALAILAVDCRLSTVDALWLPTCRVLTTNDRTSRPEQQSL